MAISSSPVSPALSHPIRLFPPIALSDRLPREKHDQLVTCITRDLSTMLRLPFAVFWSTVLYPFHERYSVAKFLDACFKIPPGARAETITRKALQLFARLCIAPKEAEKLEEEGEHDNVEDIQAWVASSWADLMYAQHIITFPTLLQVTIEFHASNPEALTETLHCLFEHQRKYVEDFTRATDFVLDEIRACQKKFGKTLKGKGKGGGKGKGKGRVADEQSSSASGNGISTATDTPLQTQACSILCSAFQSFHALVSCGGEYVTEALLFRERLASSIADAYNVANIITLPEADVVPAVEVPDVYYILSQKPESTHDHARKLKASIIVFLSTLIEVAFLKPLNVLPPNPGQSGFPPPHAHGLTEQLCDLIMTLLDVSAFDGSVPYLVSAPILIDLEVYLSLSDYLKRLRDLYAASNSDSDARLDYLVSSIEHAVTFSGNANAKNIVASRRLEKADRARKQLESNPASRTSSEPVTSLPTPVASEDYIKRTSLISQVQDLFPDLGEGFIEACLLAFNDDAEHVIMKILEDDLPDYVRKVDRSLARTPVKMPVTSELVPPRVDSLAAVTASLENWDVSSKPQEPPEDTTGRPDILATRRNVFDNDEFDIFAGKKLDASKVILGKKETGDILDDKSFVQSQKERLLDSQYDDYDDEYDDTYDDVEIRLAGTVELHLPDEEDGNGGASVPPTAPSSAQDEPVNPFARFENDLVQLYIADPSFFDRSQRKTDKRKHIRNMTGMDDQQLEGWGAMFSRNPNKERLMRKFEWRGNKAEPFSSGFENNITNEPSSQDGGSPRFGKDAGRGRGRKGPRGGRGGSGQPSQPRTSSGGGQGTSSGEQGAEGGHQTGGPDLQRQRALKDKNKAKSGNHNRKGMYARKMGAAMFGGGGGGH
ncbi:hypothetical protein BC832DRAFT_545128 [Gaertneriomyces semiglobifer]|nr:hypothetical protein BC832DRAFT_545128 [Gaertneriomyces semiglobifer]